MNHTMAVMDGASLDMPRIAAVGSALRELVSELDTIFPERTRLLNQIMYALLTRHHVQMFGEYGTGKTDLMNSLFGGIAGARLLSVQMSKFINESHVFGLPNTRVMQEQGVIRFSNDADSIFKCQFLSLDEYLDAPEPLLRTLLGILNERVFKRGRQVENCDLHTALVATNCDPWEEIRKNQKLGAVLDRILFWSHVNYLTTSEARIRMYQKFAAGQVPSTKIAYGDLKYVSDIVLSANQITDPEFFVVYDQVIEDFCKGRKGQDKNFVISDRRKCKLLQVVEANALLYGRYDVDYEDILAAQWGICLESDPAELVRFEAVAKPIIQEAKKKKGQNLDEVQIALIKEYQAQIPKVPRGIEAGALVDLARTLLDLRKRVEGVRPQLPSTEAAKNEVLEKIGKKQARVQKLIQDPLSVPDQGD